MQTSDGSEAMPALLVRPEEAARMLRISRTEIYRLIGSGDIASVRIGRRRRIPVTALSEYLARIADGYGAAREAPESGQRNDEGSGG